jgi:hypothetical protein
MSTKARSQRCEAASLLHLWSYNLRRVLTRLKAIAAFNPARSMLRFRYRSGSHPGFLTDDCGIGPLGRKWINKLYRHGRSQP